MSADAAAFPGQLTPLEWTPEGLLSDPLRAHADALRDIAHLFYGRGWSLATSSNYSVLLSDQPFRLLITASGKDKRSLGPGDFVVVDPSGKAAHPGFDKPSAETLLHVMACQWPRVGAVLHTHSVWATVLSDLHGDAGELTLSGYEMLKGLSGVSTHEHVERVRIVPNTQDIPALAHQLQAERAAGDPRLAHAFLMRNHGLYTWGSTLAEARRHVEALEFLFEVVGRRQTR